MKNFLAFSLILLGPLYVSAIVVSSDFHHRNESSKAVIIEEVTVVSNKSSSLDRNRRLISFMAFQLPPIEYPISQYYPDASKNQQAYRQSQLQIPQQQKQSVPIPNAYVHMKVPANNYRNGFQTVVYGSRHPIKDFSGQHQQQPNEDHHQFYQQPQSSPAAVPYKDSPPQKYKQKYPHNQSTPPHIHSTSKFNLTPFTTSNKVPGTFIPIVFSDKHGNSINYGSQSQPSAPTSTHTSATSPSPADTSAFKQYNQFLTGHSQAYTHQHPHQAFRQQFQQQQQQHPLYGNSYITRGNHQRPTQVPASRPSSEDVSSSTVSTIQLQHVSDIPVATSSPRPTYNVINELPDNLHHHTSLEQHTTQRPLFYTFAEDVGQYQNITPQQKYVMYLQQQLRFQQQQELHKHQQLYYHQLQQQKQEQTQRNQEQQLLYQHQQPDPIYIVNPTPEPAPQITSTQANYQQEIPPSVPVNHVIYQSTSPPRDEATSAGYNRGSYVNQIPQQQPTTIPILGNIQPQGQQQLVINQNPNYLEYFIEEPQQEIEVETPVKPYVLVSTPAPIGVTSPRPSYHHQPTLRLQPVQPTSPTPKPSFESLRISDIQKPNAGGRYTQGRKPIIPKPLQEKEKIVYVSPKPKYTQLFPTGTPINLKPSNKYHSVINSNPTTLGPPASPPASPPATTEPSTNHYEYFTNASQYTNSQYPHPTLIPTPAPQPEQPSITYQDLLQNSNILPPEFKTSSSLAELLRKLQESNHLPQTLTPDNIDNSIRTLIKILNNLKNSQTIIENPAQLHEEDYDYNNGGSDDSDDTEIVNIRPNKPGPNTGRPGIDYPALATIPPTSFNCKEQRYKGFFGDPETKCQVWHYCDLNGGQASFLCPNGTIFSQVALTCDWWFNVKCSNTAQLYVLNERLYKYILPFTPKFPEDYSGPLVDKYLALKFKEMEDKMRREKQKGRENEDGTAEPSSEAPTDQTTTAKTKIEPPAVDLDDIANNGSIDTYSESIQTNVSTPAPMQDEDESLPLSVRPIVVSTTAAPFVSTSSTTLQTTPDNRISVEQLEVIEIKPDGISGHIIPQGLFSSEDTSKY